MPPKGPDLKKFLGKRVSVKLNAGLQVWGKLSGFDVFMNLTLEDVQEEVSATERRALGTMVVRGSSVVELSQMDRLKDILMSRNASPPPPLVRVSGAGRLQRWRPCVSPPPPPPKNHCGRGGCSGVGERGEG